MSRTTLVTLWSFVGVFALACVLLLAWHSYSSHQATITAANDRISEAVASANEWIAGKSSLDGEAVEQRLVDALQDHDATERTDGQAALARVRQRREQLAEQARIELAEQEATAIFEDAKKRLDGNDVEKAIELIRKYVAHPHATEKTDAERLLTEAKTAVSDSLTLDTLMAMSDEEFARVKSSGQIKDDRVRHPILLAVRSETVQRNLDREVRRREEIRVAEEKRREAERLAAMERQRREEERRIAEEAKRQAAMKAEQERIAARLARLRNPIDDNQPGLNSKLFEQVINFPERFEGKPIEWVVVYNTGLRREAARGRFGFGIRFPFSSERFSSVGFGNELYFAISERMASDLTRIGIEGEQLDISFEIVKDKHRQGAYLGRIYRVYVRNLDKVTVEDLTW